MINSAEEFVKLRTSEVLEEYERAAHEEAPLHVWLDVVTRFPDMREWVAHNKTVPLQVLELLSRDRDPGVRYSVACKRKLSRELFDTLSKDFDESVRHAIVHNKKLPRAVLERLGQDSSPFVRDAALARLNREARHQEHDVVYLKRNLPESNLSAGDRGTVLMVFDDPFGYLVEFCDADGVTRAIEGLLDGDVEKAPK